MERFFVNRKTFQQLSRSEHATDVPPPPTSSTHANFASSTASYQQAMSDRADRLPLDTKPRAQVQGLIAESLDYERGHSRMLEKLSHLF